MFYKLLIGLVLFTTPALADPPPLDGFHDDQRAVRFSYWSTYSSVSSWPSIDYAVCNFSPNDALYFQWDKPRFGTGFANPLPIGKCATLNIKVDKYVRDNNTPIRFTQRGDLKQASAFLPKLKITTHTQSRFRTFIPTIQVASIVDFVIYCRTNDKKNVVCRLRWSQGVAMVGIALRLPQETMRSMLRRVKGDAIKARYIKTHEVIKNKVDLDTVPTELREAEILVLTDAGDGTSSATFTYPTEAFNFPPTSIPLATITPVFLLDANGRIIGTLPFHSMQ